MDRRTGVIVAALITALLCGIPGILAVICGFVFSFTAIDPGPNAAFLDRPVVWALSLICLGALGIIVPIVMGAYAMRERRRGQPTIIDVGEDESIPPPL